MKKILHIVRDEKFIDSAFKVFTSVENSEHDFCLIGKKSNKLDFITETKLKILSPLQFALSIPFLSFFYSCVVIHGISGDFIKASVLNFPKKVKICWIGWGFDYYRFSTTNFIKNHTLKYLNILNEAGKKKRKSSLLLSIYKIRYTDIKFLQRIDFFAPVLKEDLKFFSKQSFASECKYIDWNYLTLEDDILPGFEDRLISGNNILLGNSGSPANNHLDSFEELKKFNIKFKKVICPLSYGLVSYRKRIGEIGSERIGENFVPLYKFMPYSTYVEILLSCKYVFINSLRQLGMANIVLMLYLGSKVILDKSNPAYSFFLKNNIKVYSIEEAKSGEFQEFDLETTRMELKKIWGREAIQKKTKKMLELIQS